MTTAPHHTAKIRAALTNMKQAADAQLLAAADLREAINDYDAYLLDWAEHQQPSDEYQLTNITETAPAPEAKTPITEPTPEPVEDTPEPTQPDPEPEQAHAPAAPAAPAAPVVTFEQVRATLVDLSRSGHKDQVKQMLTDFGVAKISDVPEEKYSDLLAAAEQVAA